MSRSLTAHGIDHVVLERGRVGERWHAARWRSLHLLTPASHSALPGLAHAGVEADAFLPGRTFAGYLQAYATTLNVPVRSGVEVTAIERNGRGYQVATDAGDWQARAIVIATGSCDIAYRPAMAHRLSPSIRQLVPSQYRAPDQLPTGGVLIVGASSTGVQLAEEIHSSGRPVTLAVGDHTRVPRRYRGRDIYAWMDAAGVLDDPARADGNLEAARRQSSLQLVGRPDNRDINLDVLQRQGIRLLGRLSAGDGTKAAFAGDLRWTTSRSHARVLRVLDRIDDAIERRGFSAPPADPEARAPLILTPPHVTLDLIDEGILTIVWATGYVRSYPWLKVPVLDGRGEIAHSGGVTASPGLYVLGLPFQRRRRSSLISGCGTDVEDLTPVMRKYLDASLRQAA